MSLRTGGFDEVTAWLIAELLLVATELLNVGGL